jgi:hypothetical protein
LSDIPSILTTSPSVAAAAFALYDSSSINLARNYRAARSAGQRPTALALSNDAYSLGDRRLISRFVLSIPWSVAPANIFQREQRLLFADRRAIVFSDDRPDVIHYRHV